MRFEEFAKIHGLIINHVVQNKQTRTSTEDHPNKKNGSYRFLGDFGWVINWATMSEPAIWFERQDIPKNPINPTQNLKTMWSNVNQINDKIKRNKDQRNARAKAYQIMKQCVHETHPYLAKKGFPDQKWYVWNDPKLNKKFLVVPMSIDRKLVGCQLIDDEGNKKFLYGQTTKRAIFSFDAKGIPIFCEGFATALSIRQVLKASNIKYSIYVCFSASNMKLIGGTIKGGIIIADNDRNRIGETAALKTGKPYWLSETIGQDFNDFHMSVGDFKASQELKKAIFDLNKSKDC